VCVANATAEDESAAVYAQGTNWPPCTFAASVARLGYGKRDPSRGMTGLLLAMSGPELSGAEFEIRMFDKHGEFLRPLIVHAEDELEARIMAVEFCSEFDAGSFEVIASDVRLNS
jgi:hypothetical protein